MYYIAYTEVKTFSSIYYLNGRMAFMFKRIKFLLLYPRLLNNLRGKDVLISDIAKLVKLLDMNYFFIL